MAILRSDAFFDAAGNRIDAPFEDISKAPDVAGLPWVRKEFWTTLADREIIRGLLIEFLAARPEIRTWLLIERTKAPPNQISISNVVPDAQYLVLSVTTVDGCSCETSAPFPVAMRKSHGFRTIFCRMAAALDVLCGLLVIGPTTDTTFYNAIPSGAVDGVNKTFMIVQKFRPGRTRVYLNGLRQQSGATNDYEEIESGGTGTGFDTIQFVVAPSVGDVILVDYDVN